MKHKVKWQLNIKKNPTSHLQRVVNCLNIKLKLVANFVVCTGQSLYLRSDLLGTDFHGYCLSFVASTEATWSQNPRFFRDILDYAAGNGGPEPPFEMTESENS